MKTILCRTLAALVRESGIPHPELARRAGVKPRTLRHHIAGGSFPLHSVDSILEELGVSKAGFLMRAAAEAMNGCTHTRGQNRCSSCGWENSDDG